EKGVSLALEDVSMRDRAHKSPEFKQKNSLGQLPVLELDDGSHLSESVAICRYFEELHPTPALFGRTPVERATVDMWVRRAALTAVDFAGFIGVPMPEGTPHLHAWHARVSARPSAQA